MIGAIALMSVFGGISIFESISGQNEAKAGGTDGNCMSDATMFCNGAGSSCYCLDGGVTVKPHKK